MIELQSIDSDEIFTIENKDDVTVEHWIRVDSEEYIMRLDKIIEGFYGTCDVLDHICLYNNIDSPFHIKVGDVIALPNLNSLKDSIKKSTCRTLDMNSDTSGELVKKTTPNRIVDGRKTYTKTSNGILKF